MFYVQLNQFQTVSHLDDGRYRTVSMTKSRLQLILSWVFQFEQHITSSQQSIFCGITIMILMRCLTEKIITFYPKMDSGEIQN